MATSAKKIDKLTLGPVLSENDRKIALDEIRTKLNLVIESLNQIITELNA